MQVKRRAGFRCQLCNSQMDLVAHHRCYDHQGNELEHLDDLTCLCQRCHSIFHCKTEPGKVNTPKVKPPKRMDREITGSPKYEVPHLESEVLRDMPEGCGPITLSLELVNRLRTNGAFCNGAIRPLGLTKKDMIAGWPRRLVGMVVSREVYEQCLRGRYQYGVILNP